MQDFATYDAQNPGVWDAFIRFAKQTKARGFKNYSAKGIFELIRWHTGVQVAGDGFKCNNNFTADYARKMADEYPEFAGFFRTRELKAERVPLAA